MSTLGAWHSRHTGVEWAWTPIPRPWTPWMCRRFIDGRLWFLIKKSLHWWRYISRPLRSVSSNLSSGIAFSWKFFLFPIHITLLWEDIYIYVHHVCSERISLVLYCYIANLLTLKLRGFQSDSNQCPFPLQPDVLSITGSNPEALSDIFGYIWLFSLISTLN